MVSYELATVTTAIIVVTIAYLQWKLKYWSRIGVPSLAATIPFGNAKDLMFGRCSFGEQFLQFYKSLKNKGLKYGGVYLGPTPLLVPMDPELVKHIMQIDFQHFTSHGGYLDEESDPLSGHLFNLDDVKWRNLRAKMTPTFTSGKMKMMFQTVVQCCVGLKDVMEEAARNHKSVDIRDVLGRYGTDVIGSVAFGLEINSLKDPDTLFRKFGKKAVELDLWDNLKIFLQVILPHRLLKAMKHKFTKADVEQFFMKAIRDIVDYREKNNIYRRDFMHLLLQLKNRGTVADDEKITDGFGKTGEKALTMNELAAQAYVFFMAGYETSSATLTFTLFELAVNTNIQEKLRTEVNAILDKYNGELTYEAVREMTYLDKVIYETLRKYPPLPILMRKCTEDYTLPNTSITLKKGTGVMIPVLGLQTDPEYYPDPHVFEPERFAEETKQSRPSFTWLPFGDGPRICIGQRFGMLQSKVGLATILSNYTIHLSNTTNVPLKFVARSFGPRVDGGVWLDVKKLEKQ